MSAAHEEIFGDGGSRILLICDHATNTVPPKVSGGSLGLPPEEMGRHIAYDLGARGVALECARRLGAPAVLTRFSRLVIDPNRGEDDPTLVMRLYDGTIIPANRLVTPAEVERRLAAYHRPYHDAVDAAIHRIAASGRRPALISIHSSRRPEGASSAAVAGGSALAPRWTDRVAADTATSGGGAVRW